MNVPLIRSWVLSGAGRTQPTLTDVDPALIFDNGIFRITTDAIEHVTQTEPFIRVRLVAEVQTESSLCLVADGTDPVTNMRHRQAWVFEFVAGKIARIILTSSAQIPEQPYDGSFPLRSTTPSR